MGNDNCWPWTSSKCADMVRMGLQHCFQKDGVYHCSTVGYGGCGTALNRACQQFISGGGTCIRDDRYTPWCWEDSYFWFDMIWRILLLLVFARAAYSTCCRNNNRRELVRSEAEQGRRLRDDFPEHPGYTVVVPTETETETEAGAGDRPAPR
ncbi:hypothetical protein EDD21DRAFT_369260 [Dissophora ornata]|nr:hypothetical protein EDD21DRAFT_369260 [Dissophora ornata]